MIITSQPSNIGLGGHPQQVRLVTSQSTNPNLSGAQVITTGSASPTKLTLQQIQQMGLITAKSTHSPTKVTKVFVTGVLFGSISVD